MSVLYFDELKQPIEKSSLNWGDIYYESLDGNINNAIKKKWFPLHQYQKQVVKADNRFIGAFAGTGGGKTVAGPIWCIRQIQKAIEKKGKVLGMVIAPTYKVLSRATMPCFVDTLKGTAFEGVYKESLSKYELPYNWGTIWAQGADNPGGLEGGQFDFVWGDEGGQFKRKTLEAITGRTGAKQGSILLTSTPYGLGPVYEDWYLPYTQGDPNYTFIVWASIENPSYSKEEYELAKKRLTKQKFEERYLGKFMKPTGRVYPDFERCLVSLSSGELQNLVNSEGRNIGGIDFGWNDPFVCLCGKLKPDNKLYVWFERYKSKTIIDDHSAKIPKNHIYFADHDLNQISRLRRGGHTIRKAYKKIEAGIIAVNSRIGLDQLYVIENRCPATCAEAITYVYPEKDEVHSGDKPIDKDNHAMDALRYMIATVDRRLAV